MYNITVGCEADFKKNNNNNILSSATLFPTDSPFHKLTKHQLFDRSSFPKIKPCPNLDTWLLSVYSKNQIPELTGLKDEEGGQTYSAKPLNRWQTGVMLHGSGGLVSFCLKHSKWVPHAELEWGRRAGTCPWSWVSVVTGSRSMPNVRRAICQSLFFFWLLTLLFSCIRGWVHRPLACFWQEMPLKMDVDVVITGV